MTALVSSALAALSMKQGTVMSIKNIKWFILSFISFLVSLVSSVLFRCATLVDEEKAYQYKIQLHSVALISQKVWGGILALLLAMALLVDYRKNDQNNIVVDKMH